MTGRKIRRSGKKSKLINLRLEESCDGKASIKEKKGKQKIKKDDPQEHIHDRISAFFIYRIELNHRMFFIILLITIFIKVSKHSSRFHMMLVYNKICAGFQYMRATATGS